MKEFQLKTRRTSVLFDKTAEAAISLASVVAPPQQHSLKCGRGAGKGKPTRLHHICQ